MKSRKCKRTKRGEKIKEANKNPLGLAFTKVFDVSEFYVFYLFTLFILAHQPDLFFSFFTSVGRVTLYAEIFYRLCLFYLTSYTERASKPEKELM